MVGRISIPAALKNVWKVLDLFLYVLSPMVIIAFVVLCIVIVNGFGEHMDWLSALKEQNTLVEGTLGHFSEGDKMIFVNLDKELNGFDSLVIYTRYYSAETLASLKEGQRVRVYCTVPPKYEARAALVDHFSEVQYYVGYFADLLVPFLLCWVVIVLHPDFLYLGLEDVPAGGKKTS